MDQEIVSDQGSCLLGSMYGPFSFINVLDGREEADDGDHHCIRNVVEVAVVLQITRSLIKARNGKPGILRIAIISPYDSQVALIQDKVGMYFSDSNAIIFKVKTVEDFEGDGDADEDLIIVSTVRANDTGSIGILSCPKKTDFILTRACHCLWIVGNGSTLIKSGSAWAVVVRDAQDRHCFFNADEDELLSKSIVNVKEELNQMDSLLDKDSVIFRTSRWTVLFSEKFKTSFTNIKSGYSKKELLYFLLKLASGWRPRNYKTVAIENSLQLVKQYRIGGLYVICTVDVVKNVECSQVLKIWDFCPLFEIPTLVKRLDEIYELYTNEYISRCKMKCLEGKLEVPISWKNIVDKFKSGGRQSRHHYESSNVSESLLLIKFYSLSSGVVNHLLSGRDGSELHLPFEVTDQEREMIMYPKSAFILGRSGTGKTTVLTTKLIQREQQYYLSLEGLYGPIICPSFVGCDNKILRQLVVTVSSKLSYAIKNHISCMMSFTCGGEYLPSDNLHMCDHDDSIAEYSDIPDSFTRLHPRYFPLVISFWKFLVMLDGSTDDSFFRRFHELSGVLSDERGLWSSSVFHAFTRKKEVTYDHFSSIYWKHFDVNLTRKLEPSMIFKEIVSHIKGGDGFGRACGSVLSRDEYVSLSEARISTLGSTLRGVIYDIFLAYENIKLEKGDFDLSDLVNDIHRRLNEGSGYSGAQMDFVYVDEVQDLTMKQISLLKYVCPNHKDGFVFAGDTAQTIARGNDFRFEDVKALFYTHFLSKSTVGNGHIGKHAADISSPDLFNLTQNFRTHNGVLKLAQSVVDLVYCFFPFTVDHLPPECSYVDGEPPAIIYSSKDNAIATIFQGSGHLIETGASISNGFGAEQVILVRDDNMRHEITTLIGKKAIVLTILECKGLEFQDVFLYNFFGSSPLRNQWRVIYNYMHTHSLLDPSTSTPFPCFEINKHSLLCSELKQLYVAITRTRHRLWICDTIDEYSKPMFEYWKKLCLVRNMELDEFLVQTIQVANSKTEWRDRGVKLFSEGNYEMAAICFERAGDVYRGKWAKAAHLRASGSRILQSNFEIGSVSLNKAAEIYEQIEKYSTAAQCYIEIKHFNKAGMIYMKKFGDTRLEDAGDCFTEAGCWILASQVYDKANIFSKCLSVCSNGRLFRQGFDCIDRWKIECSDCDLIANFLETCVLYGLNNPKNILRFAKSFSSLEDMRNFMLSRGYIDKLIFIESKIGTKLDPNMLQKVGLCEEASSYVLLRVLLYSLWASRSTGWPLKNFDGKEALLKRAKSLAKRSSSYLHDCVCVQASILNDNGNDLLNLIGHFNDATRLDHFISVFISTRKILDIHLHSSASAFHWEKNPEYETMVTCDLQHMMSEGKISSSSLTFTWNFWKERVIDVLGYLRSIIENSQEVVDSKNCRRFCFEFLGVRKLNDRKCAVCSSCDHWMKNIDRSSFHKVNNYFIMDIKQFASLSIIYWEEELFHLGMEVMEKLQALHLHSVKSLSSQFHHGIDLLHIFEVLKSIKDLEYQGHKDSMDPLCQNDLFSFLKHSFFGIMFPSDWRRTATRNMFLLRKSKNSLELLREILLENMMIDDRCGKLSFGRIGRIVMLMFGTCSSLNQMMMDLDAFPCAQWKDVIDRLNTCDLSSISQQVFFVQNLSAGLRTMFYVEFKVEVDYVTPQCFVYLIDRLVLFASSFQEFYYSTRSSILEAMLTPKQHQGLFDNLSRASSFTTVATINGLNSTLHFVVEIIEQLLVSMDLTKAWLASSSKNKNDDETQSFRLLVSRLVIMIGLVYLNSEMDFSSLSYLIHKSSPSINWVLPQFRKCFHALRKEDFMENYIIALAEFGDPLVMVDHGKESDDVPSPVVSSSELIVINLKCKNLKETMLDQLFWKNQPSGCSGSITSVQFCGKQIDETNATTSS